jgi:hypothetical protein
VIVDASSTEIESIEVNVNAIIIVTEHFDGWEDQEILTSLFPTVVFLSTVLVLYTLHSSNFCSFERCHICHHMLMFSYRLMSIGIHDAYSCMMVDDGQSIMDVRRYPVNAYALAEPRIHHHDIWIR